MKKIILFTMLAFSHALAAHEDAALRERIEMLEQRVNQLEQYHITSRHTGESDEAAYGYAMVSYWLGDKSAFAVSNEQPLASGRTKLGQDFSLNPKDYGVIDDSGSLFSRRQDPSLYPVASLLVEGELKVDIAGNYTLVIKPTPPREVGGSGNVELAVDIYINDKKVLSQPYSSTLAPTELQLTLPESEIPFRMELVSRSPGFGPSPTKARLYVGLQARGTVTSEPIGQFLLPPY